MPNVEKPDDLFHISIIITIQQLQIEKKEKKSADLQHHYLVSIDKINV